MKNKNLPYLVTAICIILAILLLYFFFRRSVNQRQNEIARQRAEGEVSAMFTGQGGNLPDDASRSRLMRGYVTDLQEEYVTLNTEVSLENKDRLFPFTVRTSQKTEFLCWPSSVQSPQGVELQLKDMMFTLTDETKLFLVQQKAISKQDAIRMVEQNSNMYALIGLEKSFSPSAVNIAFQVALIGCVE